ncbi:MAG: acyl--CoA ligase [Sporichthya sp.]|nr:class I adenylate-forming enzyme family protein [Sporichthya sp.]MBA3742887.1 acyl--CoA ligase [Sporichthya sp.]
MSAGRDFGELLRTSAAHHRDRVAMTCGDTHQTYGELFLRSCRLARTLADLGVEPGDRVALLGPNSRWTVEQATGVALGGFVRAALYAHQTAEVNAYLTELVDAKVLIVAAGAAEALLARRPEMPSLHHVVVYDGPAPEGALDYEHLLATASAEDPGVRTAPTDLHVIRFSAGTTGRPKASRTPSRAGCAATTSTAG